MFIQRVVKSHDLVYLFSSALMLWHSYRKCLNGGNLLIPLFDHYFKCISFSNGKIGSQTLSKLQDVREILLNGVVYSLKEFLSINVIYKFQKSDFVVVAF